VLDINNNGDVVGSYFDGTNPSQGFRYDGTTYTPINSTDGGFLQASGINDTGHVVGTFAATVGILNSMQGFLLHPDGTFSILSVPGATFTDAMGINNAGQIVGRFRDAGFSEHGFLYSGGIFSPISVPGALWTNASGINASGDIVGSFHDGTTIRGFYYSNSLFSIIDPESSVLTNAWGINDAGHIVGTFYSPTGGYHGFVAAPVPLPAAFLLFVTGLAALGVVKRMKA
jgi:probable HAF family extracellular repeat protein